MFVAARRADLVGILRAQASSARAIAMAMRFHCAVSSPSCRRPARECSIFARLLFRTAARSMQATWLLEAMAQESEPG